MEVKPCSLFRSFAAISLVAVSACGGQDGGSAPPRGAVSERPGAEFLASYFSWGKPVSLEENSHVINVEPHVTLDGAGNFVVADRQEAQIRVYAPTGKLVRALGREGGGPSEFKGPVRALQRSSGDVVVVDGSGKVAVFPPDGEQAGETFFLPFGPIYDADLIGDSLLVVTGRLRAKKSGSPLLHVFDLRSRSVRNSFFPPPALRGNRIEANVGFASATLRGDTIAAVYSVSDSVYLFRPDGSAIATVPLNSGKFRRIESRPPRRGASLQELLAWVSTFSLMSDVYWSPNGDFLVQYQDRDGSEIMWRLARVTREGKPVFDVQDTPRVLASSPDGARLVFIAPDSETPNVWVDASFSR